jgi:multiple sugar transport system permease protein
MALTKRLRKIANTIIFIITLALVMMPVLFIFYWMIATSLKTQIQNISYPPLIFSFEPTLENYRSLFQETPYLKQTANTFIVALGATALGLIFGLPMAYGVARYKQEKLALVVLIARMGPGVSYTVPWFIIFSRLHLLDSYISLILTYTTLTLPLITWIMVSFFEDLPIEIEESARIDGCSPYGIFFKISLPLTLPGITAASVLSFIFAWNQFLFPLVLSGLKTRPLPIAIFGFVQFDLIDWGGLASAVTLVNLPVIIIALILQRYLVSGLTLGAVKS